MNLETDVITQTTARLEEATFPPYHPFHGTNQTMRWRRVTFEMRGASAVFEMRVVVPVNASPGSYTLGWDLDTGSTNFGTATASFTVR